jgi:hypothetical protein
MSNEKLKDSGKVADVFSSFFLAVAENLNLHQVEKEDKISFLKGSFSSTFPGIKLLQTLKLR